MYEITVAEEDDQNNAINGEDDEDEYGHKIQKPPPEPEIKEIWKVEGIDVIREQSKDKTPFDRAWFDRDLHSAVSIQDRIDKEKNKNIKPEEVF